MDKQETFFDQIARQQAAERELASRARKLWRQLPTLPPKELTKMFLAICRAGEEYDPHHRYRRRILRLLPDLYLVELIGVQMPMAIAKTIERRLAPKTSEDSDGDAALPPIGCPNDVE
jgi:hypothetical protein